jgi:hypothetical protein
MNRRGFFTKGLLGVPLAAAGVAAGAVMPKTKPLTIKIDTTEVREIIAKAMKEVNEQMERQYGIAGGTTRQVYDPRRDVMSVGSRGPELFTPSLTTRG